MAGWIAPRLTAAASGNNNTQTDQLRPPAPPRNASSATPAITSASPAVCPRVRLSPRNSTAPSTANSGVTLPTAPATAGPNRSLERTAKMETTTGNTTPTPAKISAALGWKVVGSTKSMASPHAMIADPQIL